MLSSNLGGQGGQRTDAAGDATLASEAAQAIRIGRIGVTSTLVGEDGEVIHGQDAPVDLLIRNTSGYEGWATASLNGLTGSGFGLINLAAPRLGAAGSSETHTSVELELSFVHSLTSAPLTLPRTYFSIYDLDVTPNGRTRECVQASDYSEVHLSDSPPTTLAALWGDQRLVGFSEGTPALFL